MIKQNTKNFNQQIDRQLVDLSRRIGIRLTQNLANRLYKFCQEKEKKCSETIREAIAEYLDKHTKNSN